MNSVIKVLVGPETMKGVLKFEAARKAAHDEWATFARQYGASETKFQTRPDFAGGCGVRALCFDDEATVPAGFRRSSSGLQRKNYYEPFPRNQNPGKAIAKAMGALKSEPHAWSIAPYIGYVERERIATANGFCAKYHAQVALESLNGVYVLHFTTNEELDVPVIPADCTPISDMEYLMMLRKAEGKVSN